MEDDKSIPVNESKLAPESIADRKKFWGDFDPDSDGPTFHMLRDIKPYLYTYTEGRLAQKKRRFDELTKELQLDMTHGVGVGSLDMGDILRSMNSLHQQIGSLCVVIGIERKQ